MHGESIYCRELLRHVWRLSAKIQYSSPLLREKLKKKILRSEDALYLGVGLCRGCEDKCGLLVSSGIEITGTTIH